MGESNITADGQPLTSFILYIGTCVVALETRAFDSTLVIEVSEGCIVIQFVRSTTDIDVVLLSQCSLERLVLPVIRSVVVLSVGVSEFCQRVELTVTSDEHLSFRKGVNLITRLGGKVLVCQLPCSVSAHVVVESITVVECLV